MGYRAYAAGAVIAALACFAGPPAHAGALHGYCAGTGQCLDNGTNSPAGTNPPAAFGFTVSPGPQTGDLILDVLAPNNEAQPTSFTLTGTLSGTASLFSLKAWTTGQLDAYLGISASPANPIGAYLPSTQALDPGATGFFVYQVNLGTATLRSSSNPNVSPQESISPDLPLASYIVGFLNVSGTYTATANSGAIFEASPPHTPVPEPATLAILGSGLIGIGLLCGTGNGRRRAK